MTDIVRVFVGCSANGEDAESQAVLEHSIRKRASLPVDIVWMALSRAADSPWFSDGQGGGWNAVQWATPFSGFRWAIPEICGFEGRAIYTDSDVIFLADIAELWRQEFAPGKIVMAKGGASWRLCVSLWDCALAAAYVKRLAYLRGHPGAHQEMIAKFKGAKFVQAFRGAWNYCDNEDFLPQIGDPSVKAVHYTSIDTQPSTRYAIPRLKAEGRKHWYDGPLRPHPRREIVELFDHEFAEAKAAGYLPENYAPAEPFGDYRKRSLKGYGGRHAA